MAWPVQFFFRGLRTVGLVLLYYVFSIGITFYNKWLMKVRTSMQLVVVVARLDFSISHGMGGILVYSVCFCFPQGFHYPLFMTLVHLGVNFCLSALTRRAMQCWTGKPRIILTWKDYLRKVAPTGKLLLLLDSEVFSLTLRARGWRSGLIMFTDVFFASSIIIWLNGSISWCDTDHIYLSKGLKASGCSLFSVVIKGWPTDPPT